MQAILSEARWGRFSPEQLSAALRVAGGELLQASDLLDGAVDDDAKFLEDDHGEGRKDGKKGGGAQKPRQKAHSRL